MNQRSHESPHMLLLAHSQIRLTLQASNLLAQRGSQARLTQQSGVALFMVLMVTLVIVALSVSLAVGVFSEHKVSRNTADHAIARQAAEAALRDAEQDILCQKWNNATSQFEFHSSIVSASNPNPNKRQYCTQMPKTCTQIGDAGATAACSDGLVSIPLSTGSASPSSTTDYKNTSCHAIFGSITGQPGYQVAAAGSATVSTAPYYTIEVYSDVTGNKGLRPVFRIRARGFGRDPSTVVDLESTYRPCDQ